jgi:hypothetical protein
VKKFLPFLQQLVAADRTAIASAIIGALVVLAARFGFKMNGSDVAYLSAGVTAALGVFVHSHFANAAAKAEPHGQHEAPAAPAGGARQAMTPEQKAAIQAVLGAVEQFTYGPVEGPVPYTGLVSLTPEQHDALEELVKP